MLNDTLVLLQDSNVGTVATGLKWNTFINHTCTQSMTLTRNFIMNVMVYV